MLLFSRFPFFALIASLLGPGLVSAFVHQNVSIKLFQSTGQVKVVTSAEFYRDILDLTNRSLAINAIAQNITILNGPLGVVGLGPYPQVIQGMADLITASQSYLLTIYSTPKIYDAPSVTNITSAYQNFVVAHSTLMQTLIQRAGLFAVVPAIGNSLSQAINLDLVLVRGFWAALYHTYPDAQARLGGNQQILELFTRSAVQEYQGILKPEAVAALQTQIITPLAGAVGTVLSFVGSLVTAVPAVVPSDLSSLLGGVGGGVASVAPGLGGGVSSLAGGLGGGVNSLASNVGSLVGGPVGSALTGVGGGVGSALSGLGAGLGSLLGGGGGAKTSTSVPVTASPTPSIGLGISSSSSTSPSSIPPIPTATTRSALPLSTPPALSSAPATINIPSLLSSVSALSSSLLTPSMVTSPSATSQVGNSVSSPVSPSSSAPSSSSISSTKPTTSIRPPYTTTITSTYATSTTSPVLILGLGGSTVIPVFATTTYTSTVTPTAAANQARGEQEFSWTA